MARMKLAEAAVLLGVTAATLRQQIAKKRLRARRLGRDWYVSADEVARYRRESSGKPGPKPGKMKKDGNPKRS